MDRKYEIRSIADLLTVPQDRRAACLVDLGEWLKVAQDSPFTDQLGKDLGLEGIGKLVFDPSVFRWCDDGVAGISGCRITNSEGEELLRVKFADDPA